MTVGRCWPCPPTLAEISFARGFRRNVLPVPLSHGPPKLLGTAGPATDGLRASIKNAPRIADFISGRQMPLPPKFAWIAWRARAAKRPGQRVFGRILLHFSLPRYPSPPVFFVTVHTRGL